MDVVGLPSTISLVKTSRMSGVLTGRHHTGRVAA